MANEKVFLWVNKHSNGVDIDRADSFNITSHVSKNHRKWLKLERQKKLNSLRPIYLVEASTRTSTPATLNEHQDSLVQSTSNPNGRRHVVEGKFLGATQPTGADNTSSLNQKTRNEDPRNKRIAKLGNGTSQLVLRQRSDQGVNPSIRTYKGNSDPFNASAVPLTPERSQALRSALRCFVFAAWPADADSVFRARIGEQSSHINLSHAISSDAELHAILASGYLIQNAASQEPQQQVLAHRLRSLELLRERLQSTAPLANILTLIRLLISLDFNSGDFDSARVHLRGIRSLCQSNVQLYDNLREVVRTSDVWIAMALLSKPDIDPAQHDPGPPSEQRWRNMLSEDQKKMFEYSDLPADISVVLGTELDRLLRAAKEVMCSKQVITMPGSEWARSRMVFWTSRRGSATTGGLMSQYADERTLSEQDTKNVDVRLQHKLRAAAALTIILYMNIHWMDMAINYDFSRTFKAIEPLLRYCSVHLTTASKALKQTLLWLVFIAAMGDDIFAARGSLSFSGWAAAEFVRLCSMLDLTTFEVAKESLQAIAYREGIMDEFLRKLLYEGQQVVARQGSILPFDRWRAILNHYVAH